MEDRLLLHAKRLSAAASAIAEGLASSLEGLNRQKEATNSDKSLPKSPPKQFDTVDAPLRICVESNAGEILRTSKSEFSPAKIFRGAAFNGSSLLTTYTDLRPFLLKGQLFSVDGISCRFKEDGEYSSSRLEMQEDFTGPTNIDAVIKFDLNKDALKRKLKSKKTMMPVDSDDIKQATSSLDNIPYLNSPKKPKATLPKLLNVVKESRRLETGESPRRIGIKKAVKPTLSETLYSQEDIVQRQQEMNCRIVKKAKETATLRAIKWKEEQRAKKREAKAEQEALSEQLKQRFSQKAEELQQRTLLRVKELKREENEKRMQELAEKEQENMARQEREALSRAEVQVERSRLLRRETEERLKMQERRRLAEEESLRRMEARRLQELLAANGRLQPMSLPNLSAPSVTSVASSKKKKVMMMKTAEDTVSLPSIRAHSARRSKVMPASLPPLFTTTKSAGGNEGPKQSSPLRTENPSQEQEDINPRSASGTRIPTRRRHPRARNSDAPQNADNKPRVETVKVKRDQDEEDDSISDDSIRDLKTFESSDFNSAGAMNSSPVSSLTNESVTSYSGQFNNLSRKKKNKTKAWRLAPIPLKPYVPIPGEQSLR